MQQNEAASTTAQDLADLPVQDEDGATHRLAEIWRDRTAVLAFVRHFG